MKILLLTSLLILSVSCSKEPKKIQDEAPQFNVGSSEIKIAGIESPLVMLNRGEIDNGPLIELFFDSKQQITRSERTLSCSGHEIKGKAFQNNDPRMFVFKLSDSEFPGLQNLPSRSNCKLAVKLENTNGSSVKKEIPLKFHFDKSQALEVKKLSGSRGLIDQSAGLIPLDIVEVKNPLNYAVGVTYKAESNCFGFTAARPPTSNANGTSKNGEPYAFYANQIQVSGMHEKLEGDFRTFVSFMIPAGQSVKITASSNSLRQPNSQTGGLGPSGAQMILQGAYIDHCVNHYEATGLYVWGDMQKTLGDNLEPVKYWFSPGSIGTLPGLRPY